MRSPSWTVRPPRARVLDPAFPLYVTESPRKADAAISHGLACVDFPGIRMLRLDDATWDYIGVKDRDVRVCFDGDVAIKGDVETAEWWLHEYLTSKGARVAVYRLPVNLGLDDYLAKGQPIDALPAAKLAARAPDVWIGWRPRRTSKDLTKRERALERAALKDVDWGSIIRDAGPPDAPPAVPPSSAETSSEPEALDDRRSGSERLAAEMAKAMRRAGAWPRTE